ncbi:Imm10 family immunity protein [Streptomyces sp. NPDC015127]|uniref:Imm10 family immunity protein n=1 Tax=Streptomyces sp. NPDC015127 TaxID=3364939 RepID=UPI003701B26E
MRQVEETDGGLFIHGGEGGEEWCFNFQECYDLDDEQEIELGMDTYCVVVEPGQRCYYGGIVECVASGREVRLVFTSEAAEALEVETHCVFSLDVPDSEMEVARSGLREILSSGRPDSIPLRIDI